MKTTNEEAIVTVGNFRDAMQAQETMENVLGPLLGLVRDIEADCLAEEPGCGEKLAHDDAMRVVLRALLLETAATAERFGVKITDVFPATKR